MAGLWDVPVWRKYRAKVKKFRKANPGPNTIGFQPVLRYVTSSALFPADGNYRTGWKPIPRVASNHSQWGFTELTGMAGQVGSLSHGSVRSLDRHGPRDITLVAR